MTTMGLVEVTCGRAATSREERDALLREAVARFCEVSPADVSVGRLCPACGGSEHGRPYALTPGSPPQVSVSRTGDVVLVAVADDGPVGVDVEHLDTAGGWDRLDGVLLHPAEAPVTDRDRAVLWVRKEALLKATGRGLAVRPDLVRVTASDEEPRLLAWQAPDTPAAVRMYDVDVDAGLVACVAVLSAGPHRLVVHPAGPAATVP